MAEKSTSSPGSLSSDQRQTTRRSTHRKARSEQQEELVKQSCGSKSKRRNHSLPSPNSEDLLDCRKNKRKREEEDSGDGVTVKPPVKQRHSKGTTEQIDEHTAIVEQTDPVNHWVQNDFHWSRFLRENATMAERSSSPGSKKRSLSNSTSYRQSTLSGETPKAWGAKHALAMLDASIFMEQQTGATITDDDVRLCNDILEARYELPKEWRFQGENLSTIVNLVLYKNERRIVRDLGPHVMPSPELLKAQGHPGLEHITEAIDAQWIKCTSLCGPKSQPDVTHGVSRFIFSEEEREKLITNNTCTCETMMFPFYICEAKCFDRSIGESELQALHGASVASNAVIELYQKILAAEELDRRILAFSVSHNHRLVKIFAHFALINGSKISFHRHQLFETDLLNDQSSQHRPYQIALAIWEHFYPVHLRRIREALARQQGRAVLSFTTRLGPGEGSARGISAPLPQDDSSAIVELQQENSRLFRMVEQGKEFQQRLDRQLEQQKQEQKEQQEMMERRLAQRTQEHNEMMERRLAQRTQEHNELMERRLAQQTQEQKEMMERYLAHTS